MYIGRFAPSPTGPLHFGSLLAALASYLDARSHQGRWLLRIEDLDTLREKAGASEQIIAILDDYGFRWDGEILWQSRRLPAYQQALHQLQKFIYPCTCSRKQLLRAEDAQFGTGGLIYPGHCRTKSFPVEQQHAIRIRVPAQVMTFRDRLQGVYSQQLAQAIGDFIVRRSDNFFAYQLAVVVDDEFQGVTHIVRGADLLDNTPRQLFLQNCLGYRRPSYLHIPLMQNEQGEKLSKQTHAPALKSAEALANLVRASACLGQNPPALQTLGSVSAYWDWAITHWNPAAIPPKLAFSGSVHTA